MAGTKAQFTKGTVFGTPSLRNLAQASGIPIIVLAFVCQSWNFQSESPQQTIPAAIITYQVPGIICGNQDGNDITNLNPGIKKGNGNGNVKSAQKIHVPPGVYGENKVMQIKLLPENKNRQR